MTFFTEHFVLSDAARTLPNSGTKGSVTFNFDPPNDAVIESNRFIHSPVLSYRADPSNGAKNIKLNVYIQNSGSSARARVSSFTLGGTVSRTVFEVIQASEINKSPLILTFEVESTNAGDTLTINDVVLWLKRNA